MKKTKKTMLTSALLSAAVAMQTDSLINAKKADTSAPVYGPPPAIFGDINQDNSYNIVDFILLKSQLTEKDENGTAPSLADLNRDGIISSDDLRIFQRYLFGKIPDFQEVYPEDRDDNPESENKDEPAFTSVPSDIPQTKYGPPVILTEEPQPVTTIPDTDIPQPLYGSLYVFENEDD